MSSPPKHPSPNNNSPRPPRAAVASSSSSSTFTPAPPQTPTDDNLPAYSPPRAQSPAPTTGPPINTRPDGSRPESEPEGDGDGDEGWEEDDGEGREGAFWCHLCQIEVRPMMDSGTPTCPICHGEFVEEIDEDNDPRGFADEHEHTHEHDHSHEHAGQPHVFHYTTGLQPGAPYNPDLSMMSFIYPGMTIEETFRTGALDGRRAFQPFTATTTTTTSRSTTTTRSTSTARNTTTNTTTNTAAGQPAPTGPIFPFAPSVTMTGTTTSNPTTANPGPRPATPNTPPNDVARLLQTWLQQMVGEGAGVNAQGERYAHDDIQEIHPPFPGSGSIPRSTTTTAQPSTTGHAPAAEAPGETPGANAAAAEGPDVAFGERVRRRRESEREGAGAGVGGQTQGFPFIPAMPPSGRPVLDLAAFLEGFLGPTMNPGTGTTAGQQQLPNPFRELFNMVGNPGDYVFGQRGLDDIVSQLMEQTQQRNAPPPAAPSTIASLPKITITEKDLGANPTSTSNSYNANSENTDKVYTRDCPICQDDFNVGDEAVRLPCKHVFHEGCVGSWLGVNGTCPVCRYSLVNPADNASTPTTTSTTNNNASNTTQQQSPQQRTTNSTGSGGNTTTQTQTQTGRYVAQPPPTTAREGGGAREDRGGEGDLDLD